ncbi:iron ABC transporter ATP-binding protein [Candidatus Acidianus copahuensis]|uniref:Iron ABC transporter ATP-binding protein n=2 Tax=Acidianus TaxID=12914 RepID=A0A031LTH2_9CREN|nr:ABC transporter ATP-binding protein [Candidatus Acidianus copahuensis]EZQ11050.1 iron ABC transporter ATP-binding protein [Candidatus Acidianus copahuensis]
MLRNISVEINGKRILDNVSFEPNRGINVILGPNGSGKTTLLRVIIGMVKKTEGKVSLKGKISYVPAEFFSAQMKVSDVMLAGSRIELNEYTKVMKKMEIQGLINRDFSTLSSGEKRLVLIVKSLVEGDVVLMDEPLGNLDLANRAKVLRILKEYDKTFIITSHEIEVLDFASKVLLLKNGKVLYSGNPADVNESLLSELYNVKLRRGKDGWSNFRFDF